MLDRRDSRPRFFRGSEVTFVVPVVVEPVVVEPVVEPVVVEPVVVVPPVPPHGPGVLAGAPEMMQASRSRCSSTNAAWTSTGLPTSVAGVSTEAVAGVEASPPLSSTQYPF